VLILLPASDRKATVRRGAALDPGALSFPTLAPTRAAVTEALIDVSAQPEAPRRLGVPATLGDAVRQNLAVLDAPTAPAGALYRGVMYDALALGDLDAAARRRARAWIVVISALWGAVRLGDRIPSYRLDMCGRLPGLAHLPEVWRAPLDDVLPAAAGAGVVVDCRSSEYATAWRPTGALAERTVVVKVVRADGSGRGVGSHNAKLARGLLVRRIVTEGLDPRGPEELATALSAHGLVDLEQPRRAGRSWELRIVEPLTR
jgi:uncharacterized protein